MPSVSRTLIQGIDSRCWIIPPQDVGADCLLDGTARDTIPDIEMGVGIDGGVDLPPPPIEEDVYCDILVGSECTEIEQQNAIGDILVDALTSDANTDTIGDILVDGVATDIPSEDVVGDVLVDSRLSEAEVTPGTDCATAAAMALDTTYWFYDRPAGNDWMKFDYGAVTTVHWSYNYPVGKGLLWIYDGSCASLNVIGLNSGIGCASATVAMGPGTIWIKAAITGLTPIDYMLNVGEGGC